MERHRRSAGFTLVELLVVIAIIGILIALLLPGVQKVRDSASRVRCFNNLHQIALAAHSYEANYKRFPPGLNNGSVPGKWNTPPTTGKFFGLLVALMPYVEKTDIVNQLDLTSEYKNNTNGPNSIGATVVPTYLCPGDPELPFPPIDTYKSGSTTYYFGLTSYGGCSGTSATSTNTNNMLRDGIFNTNSKTRTRDIPDGMSNTFLFGERCRVNLQEVSSSVAIGGWAWANDYGMQDHTMNTSAGRMLGLETHDKDDFGSAHSGGGGANFAFADGSVRYIFRTINASAYQRLSQRADGVPIDISKFE